MSNGEDVYDNPPAWCSLCQEAHDPCEYTGDGIAYHFLTPEEREFLEAEGE